MDASGDGLRLPLMDPHTVKHLFHHEWLLTRGIFPARISRKAVSVAIRQPRNTIAWNLSTTVSICVLSSWEHRNRPNEHLIVYGGMLHWKSVSFCKNTAEICIEKLVL